MRFITAQRGRPSVETANPGFTYTDKNLNTAFTVPANWYMDSSEINGECVNATFIPYADESVAILYKSEDQWLTHFSGLGSVITRADINNSRFSLADIAEIFNLPESDITIRRVNDERYFTFKTYVGNKVTMSAVKYNNANFYWFEFFGDERSPYFGDFLFLMESIKYSSSNASVSPASTSVTSAAVSASASVASSISKSVPALTASSAASAVSESASSAGAPVAAENKGGNISRGLYIVMAAVLFALPIPIYRYAVRKRFVEWKRALVLMLIYGGVSLALLASAVVFLGGSWIAVGAVLLWHIASYFMLVSGKRNTEQVAAVMVESESSGEFKPDGLTQDNAAEPEDAKHALYCGMCGYKMQLGDQFCPKCGEKVETLEE